MRIQMYKNISVTGDSDLKDFQNMRQEQNKGALAEFLESATVSFMGKDYGVTEEDQNEMQAMIMQYQMLTQAGIKTELQWHAKHEKCEPFELEKMINLASIIKAFVLPNVNKMQEIKERIYQATSKEEVMAIKIFEP